MSSKAESVSVPLYGNPAPGVRIFGWGMMAVLAGFLINNILTVAFDFPGTGSLIDGFTGLALVQLAVYLVAIAVAVMFVLRTPDRALRWDAHTLHHFNLYLIRACFWVVVFIGVADTAIAFARVESLFDPYLAEETVRALSRSRWVGWNVHLPLVVAGFVVAIFTRTLGFTWLALLIVVAELAIVITRFVFSYEQALMGDLVRYWYAALFLFASAYTLFDEGHVRVDVLYSGFGLTTRGMVNAIGAILLGMTTCWVIIWIGFDGKQSIINSPIANFEITQTGGTGMFIKYQMAAFLGVFAVTMLIQFISYLFEAVADYRSQPGHREPAPVAH
ncbi:TRAP transporter small permease subunit [Minwuia sp.]|uniref:TRAP transporter small permease subunit n=1 Tax=Minwuia sp. TaxID=2493630 RepID=UPI003A8CECAE